MRLPLLLTMLLTGLACASCNKGKGRCNTSTICTEDFRTVSVRLVKMDGSAPTLDSTQTVDEQGTPLRSNTGRPVYGLTGTASGGSFYADVVNDEWVSGHTNSELRVILRGFRGGAVVFEEQYLIGADCCHVYKSSGPDLITVPN